MILAERFFKIAFCVCGRDARLIGSCLHVCISLLFMYLVNIAILCPQEVNLFTLNSETDTDIYSAVNLSLFVLIKLGKGELLKKKRENGKV